MIRTRVSTRVIRKRLKRKEGRGRENVLREEIGRKKGKGTIVKRSNKIVLSIGSRDVRGKRRRRK